MDLARDLAAGRFLSAAAEWLLDNFHVVTEGLSAVERDLPATYYRQLPALAVRAHAGHARIYAIALELIRHSDSRLDEQQMLQFLRSFQRVAPLTIGELWAWPSMVKLALVENLRRLADELMHARVVRQAADAYLEHASATPGARPIDLPSPLAPDFAVQLLHRLREYGLGLTGVRLALDQHLAALDTTAEDLDPRRAPAPERRPGLGRQRRHQPAALCGARLADLRRVGQPRRRRAATRSGRRLRPHGLPQPRPAAPGRRDAGADQRRCPGAGGPARRGQCAPGARRRDAGRRTCRLPPGGPGPARSRVGPGVSAGPRAAAAAPALPRRAHPLREHRGRWHRRAGGGRRALRRRRRRVDLDAHGRRAAADGAGQRTGRRLHPDHRLPAPPAAAPAAPRVRRRRAGQRPHDGHHPDDAHEPRRRRCVAGPRRGAGARQPRSPRARRNPERLRRYHPSRRRRGRRAARARPRRAGRAGRALRPRSRRPLLPLPSRSPLERRRRRPHRLGAQARQDRRVQPVAARRDRHQLLDPRGAARRAQGRALLPDARLRHAPAPRSRAPAHRRDGTSPEPAALRSGARPRHRGLRHPAAARERHDGQRRRLALRPRLRRAHGRGPVYDGGLRRLSGPVRRGHLHRQGALRRRCLHRGPRRPGA